MTVLAALAAFALLAAALLLTLAHAAPRPAFVLPARVVAATGAALLLPELLDAGTRPLAVVGIVAGLLPRPLALALGAAAAFQAALAGGASQPASWALVTLAPALSFAGAALSSTTRSRLVRGSSLLLPAAGAGLGLVGLLACLGGGSLLRWRLALGAAASVALPGPALLFGLTLLAALAGALLVIAHLAARTSDLARVLGQRALLLAAGFATLGVGVAFAQTARLDDSLRAAAPVLTGVGALTAVLVMALAVALGQPPLGDAAELDARARFETRLATVFCIAAAIVAGVEAWLRTGAHVTSLSVGALAVGLFGLTALQPTAWAPLRRGLLLFGLIALFAGA